MPVFRCCWCQTRSEHPRAGVLVVCPECGIKFNAIDWKAKEKDMSHQFAIADVVTLHGTEQEFVVKGHSKDGKLLHLEFLGNHAAGKIYVPPASVTLVRPCTEAQAEHPSKIETAVESRDVTTLWDGGHKVHEPRKMET